MFLWPKGKLDLMQRLGIALLVAMAFTLAPTALAAPGSDGWTGEVTEVPDRAGDAVGHVVTDPEGSASDPAIVLDALLQDGSSTPEQPPAAPEEDPERDFADRIRDAFANELMAFGIAAALLSALGVGGFAFVTRYVSPKEALKNPQRAMLYGFIRGNPGVHLKKLSDEFAMKTSSILWHIRKLESAELVHSERANGFRVFYPVEGGIEIKRVSRAITALQNRNARSLFEALDAKSGVSTTDLADRARIHAGTVRWHLRKLREYGLVEELVQQEGSLFFATPLGRKALQTLAGAPLHDARPIGSTMPMGAME
jgi:DNA-binding transcriptional ArsR family regulator